MRGPTFGGPWPELHKYLFAFLLYRIIMWVYVIFDGVPVEKLGCPFGLG